MTWWKKALIASVLWFFGVIGVLFVHMEVVLKGQLTEAQEDVFAYRYGIVAGTGLPLIWAVAFLLTHLKGVRPPSNGD